MSKEVPYVFSSVADLHKALGLPKPVHPLVSLSNYQDITADVTDLAKGLITNLYKISYKKYFTGKARYGQHYYDFNEGGFASFLQIS